MAAVLGSFNYQDSVSDIAEFMQEFAQLVEALSPEEILRDINEDRLVSGFPEIKTVDLVQDEISELKRFYRNVIIDALNDMPPAKLVETMTEAVEGATEMGESRAPALIDEVVDSYEVETQIFLRKEAENVSKLVKAAQEAAEADEAIVEPLIKKLDQVVNNWREVAHPIQLSMKTRGIEHHASRAMALEIRNLGVDLFNNHGMLSQSQRIIDLLQKHFSELPEVSETLEQDASKIEELFNDRRQVEARAEEWAREITYEVWIGRMFKDLLRISTDGIEWKGSCYPLESITHVRWGGIRHSYSTAYTIGFSCEGSDVAIQLESQKIYSTFVDKLWRAVCIRLMAELLEKLSAGKRFRFGEALIDNEGVTLTKHTLVGEDESIFCNWHQIEVWSANGSFWIGLKGDEKTSVALSYLGTRNVHVLESVIRMGFKKGVHKLSDIRQGE
jgi:hypothetical protein